MQSKRVSSNTEISESDCRQHTLTDLAQVLQESPQEGTPKSSIDYRCQLSHVLKKSREVVQGSFALYNRFDLENRQIITHQGWRLPKSFRAKGRLSGRLCYEELIKSGKIQAVLSDLSKSGYAKSDPDVKRYHLKAYIGFPVILKGDVIGSLAVYNLRPRVFDAAQASHLESLAETISAIEAQRSLEAQLERALAGQKIITDISSQVMLQADTQFVHYCLQTLGQALNIDTAAIYWYSPEVQGFHPHYEWWAVDARTQRPKGASKQRSKKRMAKLPPLPIHTRVVKEQQLFCCHDIKTIPDRKTQSVLRKHNICSILAMPLYHQKRAIGVCSLQIENSKRRWQEDEIRLLTPLMTIIAQWKHGLSIATQLDESQSLNYQMIKLSPTAIYRIDFRSQRFVKVNDHMCRVTGHTEAQLLAMKPEDLLTKPSRELFRKRLFDIATGRPVSSNVEYQVKTKTGKLEWCHFHIRHLYEGRRIIGANVVAHVITEQKKAQEELANYRKKLESLVQARTKAVSQANQQLRAEVTRRSKTENALRLNSDRLKELNTAMRVMLNQRDEDRLHSEEHIRVNLRQLIEPYLDKLDNRGLDRAQRQLLEVIRANLNEVAGDPVPEITEKYYIFSPSELQVANLIRKGRTTKEMARLLNLSVRTVESYRNSIRKKLGLKNKRVNLRTYLSSII